MGLVVGFVLMVLALFGGRGCSPMAVAPPPLPRPHLEFNVIVSTTTEQEAHISMSVRNAGAVPFRRDESFTALMTLRDARGELRASATMHGLQTTLPGEVGAVSAWRGQLDPGTYHLIWGAPGHGGVFIEFEVVARDGRLELVREMRRPLGPDDVTRVPVRLEQDELVKLAIGDLAARLGVEPESIAVVQVYQIEFPDACLGLPQPDEVCAEVITPGTVIVLRAGDREYRYHAADDRIRPSF